MSVNFFSFFFVLFFYGTVSELYAYFHGFFFYSMTKLISDMIQISVLFFLAMSLDTMFCITDKIRITKLQFPSVNKSFEHHLLNKIISIPKYVNENSNIYLKTMKITEHFVTYLKYFLKLIV